MPYVYSTASSSINFGAATIKGGAGVADNRTLITPLGVVTSVTKDQLEALQKNDTFNTLVKNGVLMVSDKKQDADKVAKDMEQKNPAKQKTEATLKTEAKAK